MLLHSAPATTGASAGCEAAALALWGRGAAGVRAMAGWQRAVASSRLASRSYRRYGTIAPGKKRPDGC